MNGWKTFAFNGAVGIASLGGGILDQLDLIDWSKVLPDGWGPFAVMAIGIVNILLRHVTTEPAAWRK
ncbi:Uncharacterised protein [Pannonibacter phragmitetus]|uniref:Uncharacterized protein n=1 Tax=Pannonibacter phragmitetus TaxID=121719 RepID=A0A378ZUT7_9HYPH|nr:hypothetical protein [Pannonibacter phragmitetus]SUB00311.1 Uncharacterised protein [Pannonibacter phragmitetus]